MTSQGHLFQGRFKAILVDTDAYLMALCRYGERKPVAAGLAASPGDWTWSNYRAHVVQADAPPCLNTAALYAQFAARMQALVSAAQTRASDIPRAQRLPALSLSQCQEHCGGHRLARPLRKAHVQGGLSMSTMARGIRPSPSLVSRNIAGVEATVALEGARGKTCPGEPPDRESCRDPLQIHPET